MTSPPGAGEVAPGALSNHEREALAAWADEGDAPDDGFADRVVAAFLAERLADARATLGEGDGEGEDAEAGLLREAARIEPRATVGQGRVVRMVGLAAAVAAAAAVMLMVRVLPRASEMHVAEARGLERASMMDAAAVEPSPTSSSEADRLAAEAALVLAQHCSPCHDSDDAQASPSALQVFDVEQPQWWRFMSDAQLEEASMRVRQLGAASDDERRTMDAFVAARLRRDAHAG